MKDRDKFEWENGLVKLMAGKLPCAPNAYEQNPLWRVVVSVSVRNLGTYREMVFQTLPRAEARALCLFFVRAAEASHLATAIERGEFKRNLVNGVQGFGPCRSIMKHHENLP